MEAKKEIGKMFRDSLEQLNYMPSEKVWHQIEIDLNKKKKRYFLLAFLSVFLLSTVVGSIFFIFNKNAVAGKIAIKTEGNYKKAINTFKNRLTINKKVMLVKSKVVVKNKITAHTNAQFGKNRINFVNNTQEGYNSKSLNNSDHTTIKKDRIIVAIIANNRIAVNKNQQEYYSETQLTKLVVETRQYQNQSKKLVRATAEYNEYEITTKYRYIVKKNTKNKLFTNAYATKKGKVFLFNGKRNKIKKRHSLAALTAGNIKTTSNAIDTTKNLTSAVSDGASVKSAMQAQITLNVAFSSVPKLIIADSTATIKNTKKERDSLIIIADELAIKNKIKNHKIVVAMYFGPNYNGYFGQFNQISNKPILESRGLIQWQFGIMARWMVTSRFGWQVGVGKIDSRYLTTIEKTTNNFINTQNVILELPLSEINAKFATAKNISLIYESSFVEIPLEAHYVLIDKKVGLATSLGLSLLFSNKNIITAQAEKISEINIGALTNIVDGFTANSKLYLFYKFMPSLQVELYPTFQYQVFGNNSSSNNSNYYFSVRTGFSYKF